MKILRYTVPVDDRWHIHVLSGPILYVAARRPDVVELWAFADDRSYQDHTLRVYGTGQLIDEPCDYVGTAFAAGGALVWHLMERR